MRLVCTARKNRHGGEGGIRAAPCFDRPAGRAAPALHRDSRSRRWPRERGRRPGSEGAVTARTAEAAIPSAEPPLVPNPH